MTREPIDGWGEDPKKIEAVIKDEPEVLALFREAMVERPGKRAKAELDITDNVSNKTKVEAGNSKAYSAAHRHRSSSSILRGIGEP